MFFFALCEPLINFNQQHYILFQKSLSSNPSPAAKSYFEQHLPSVMFALRLEFSILLRDSLAADGNISAVVEIKTVTFQL